MMTCGRAAPVVGFEEAVIEVHITPALLEKARLG
jgi:hypothetical protein